MPSAEEGGTPSGEPSTPPQGETVPKSRFDEVYSKQKEAEKELADLKAKQTEDGAPSAEDKAFEDKVRIASEKISKEKTDASTEEQKQHDTDVDNILTVYTDVDRDNFTKFIEENSEKYSITSVQGAMNVYRDINKMAAETEEQTKQRLLQKPALPRNEGNPSPGAIDDSNKTIEQIAEEAAQEIANKPV